MICGDLPVSRGIPLTDAIRKKGFIIYKVMKYRKILMKYFITSENMIFLYFHSAGVCRPTHITFLDYL